MKILVTGGLGYLGSVLVPELLRQGHLVTVVDNCMYNQTSLLDYCMSSNLEIIRKDITNLRADFFNQFEIIIPLAWLTGAPLCDYKPYEVFNLKESYYFMLDSITDSVKIIYPNTNSGYGLGQDDNFCTEETPLNPISLYGIVKCEVERVIMRRENSIALRLATVFGMSPRMRLDLLVNDFVYRAVNDGFVVLYEPHFKRNYIHVRDVAKAFVHCIDNWDSMKNQVYNVGLSSANLSKLELCQEIQKQIPNFTFLEAPIGEDKDKRNYIVSNAKLEATGWKPTFDLQDGIRELRKGYQIIKRNSYANI